MALSADLGRAGHQAETVETTATVDLDMSGDAPTIARIVLDTRARVPGIDVEELRRVAEGTKQNCPVSRALAAVPDVQVNAELVE
jgi:osmotically inducible protein OsmC